MRGDRRDRSARFGRLLRGHRVAAGLTQEILAERSGLSVEAISTLERGFRQHPRKDTVRMLSQAMRLAPVDEEALTAAARRAPSPRARPDEVGSIPRPHQPLVGLECEMEAAASLILRPDVRKVTLTGPP